MKWFIAALIATIGLMFVGVNADMLTTGVGRPGTYGTATCGGYTGLGDILTFSAYYATRPYSAAYVGTPTKAVQVRRASDNTTSDINVTCNSGAGGFDRASLITFADTSAVCTGAIATTTLTIASCSSGTIALNDLVTGTGIAAGTVITAIGTCGAGAGTCTVNNSQTVVSETITTKQTTFITKWYDQSGNGRDQTYVSSVANQAKLLWAAVGTFPCGKGSSSAYTATIPSTASRPMSFTGVVAYPGGGTVQTLITTNGVGGNGNEPGVFHSAANAETVWEGSPLNSSTITDGNFMAVSAAANGASSAIEVNGTRTTGNTGSVGGSTTALAVMSNTAGGQVSTSQVVCETGAIFATAITSGNQTSLDTNMRAYYGNLF